jgi:hypothetical protein
MFLCSERSDVALFILLVSNFIYVQNIHIIYMNTI